VVKNEEAIMIKREQEERKPVAQLKTKGSAQQRQG